MCVVSVYVRWGLTKILCGIIYGTAAVFLFILVNGQRTHSVCEEKLGHFRDEGSVLDFKAEEASYVDEGRLGHTRDGQTAMIGSKRSSYF